MAMLRMRRFATILVVLLVLVASPSAAQPADGEALRRNMFIEHYVEALQRHPEALATTYAFLFDATASSAVPQENKYRDLVLGKQWGEIVEAYRPYIPKIGIGISRGIPLGNSKLSGSASVDLTPILVAGIKRLGGALGYGPLTPEAAEQGMRELALSDQSTLRGLGDLAFRAYGNFGDLGSLHSLYWLAKQGAPDLPAPDASPSAYIDNGSPILRGYFNSKLAGLSESARVAVLSDWSSFAKFLEGTLRASKTVERPSPDTRWPSWFGSTMVGSDQFRSTYRLLLSDQSFDPDVSGALQSDVSDSDNYEDIYDDYVKARTFTASMERLAQYMDPGARQSVTLLSNATELYYQWQLARTATDPTLAAAAGMSGLAAAGALLNGFQMQPDPTAKAFADLMAGQREILAQIQLVNQKLEILRLGIIEMQSKFDANFSGIHVSIAEVRKDIRSLRERMDYASEDVLASLRGIDSGSALDASFEIRQLALTDQCGKQAHCGDLSPQLGRLSAFLAEKVAQEPHIFRYSLDRADGTDSVDLDWSYSNAIANHVLRSWGRYIETFESAQFGRLLRDLRGSVDFELGRERLKTLEDLTDTKLLAPASFEKGAVLLADAIVRLPESLPITLDLSAPCTLARSSSQFWSTLFSTFPILAHVTNFDLVRLQETWNGVIRELGEQAFPQIHFDPIGEPDMLRYLASTGGNRLGATFHCTIEPTACSDDLWIAPVKPTPLAFLVAAGVVDPTPRFDRISVFAFYNNYPNYCFRVSRSYPWLARIQSEYPSLTAESPNGYVEGIYVVCKQTRLTTNEVYDALSDKRSDANTFYTAEGNLIWDQDFFYSFVRSEISDDDCVIDDGRFSTGNERSCSLKKSNESASLHKTSNSVASRILEADQQRIVEIVRAYFSQSTSSLQLFRDALRNVKHDALSMLSITSLAAPRCRSMMLRRYVSPITKYAGDGKFVSLADQVNGYLREGNLPAVHELLWNIAAIDSYRFDEDKPIVEGCYHDPVELERGMILLATISQRVSGSKGLCTPNRSDDP